MDGRTIYPPSLVSKLKVGDIHQVLCSFVLYIVLGDNGSLWFWDWKSGHNFQQAQTIVQPGTSPLYLFPLDLAMRGMEKRFMLKAIFLQAHWIVKLVYMLPAMI